MKNLRVWNFTMLILSIIVWITLYLGPLFMILLGILNLYTSFKIYTKKNYFIQAYWILATLNLFLIFFQIYKGLFNTSTEFFIIVVIIFPYLLSIYLLKLIK